MQAYSDWIKEKELQNQSNYYVFQTSYPHRLFRALFFRKKVYTFSNNLKIIMFLHSDFGKLLILLMN